MSKPKREKGPVDPHKPPADYVIHHPEMREEEPLATERNPYRTRTHHVAPSVKVAL